MKCQLQSMSGTSLLFVISPDTEVWESLLRTILRLRVSKTAMRGLGLSCTIWTRDQPVKCGRCYMFKRVRNLVLHVGKLQKEARLTLLADHTFQFREFGKTAPLRRFFQTAWFQLLQVTSLAALTTGRTEVTILQKQIGVLTTEWLPWLQSG